MSPNWLKPNIQKPEGKGASVMPTEIGLGGHGKTENNQHNMKKQNILELEQFKNPNKKRKGIDPNRAVSELGQRKMDEND